MTGQLKTSLTTLGHCDFAYHLSVGIRSSLTPLPGLSSATLDFWRTLAHSWCIVSTVIALREGKHPYHKLHASHDQCTSNKLVLTQPTGDLCDLQLTTNRGGHLWSVTDRNNCERVKSLYGGKREPRKSPMG